MASAAKIPKHPRISRPPLPGELRFRTDFILGAPASPPANFRAYQLAGKDGDFLIQEIFSATQGEALDLNFRCVSGFRSAEGKMSKPRSPVGRGATARPKVESGEDDNDGGGGEEERKSMRAASRRLIGSLNLRLLVHGTRVSA